jgi:hypothetical protein
MEFFQMKSSYKIGRKLAIEADAKLLLEKVWK